MAPNLPERCFAVNEVDKQLIVIYRGENGFHPAGNPGSDLYLFGDEAEQMRDKLNNVLKVTPAQRNAMVLGSIFGWHVPAANPEHEMAQMAVN